MKSDLLGWRQASGNGVLPLPYVFPIENCQNYPQFLLGWAVKVFECLQGIFFHKRLAKVDSVIFTQLFVDFRVCLEKVFKQLKLLRFPVKRGHRGG